MPTYERTCKHHDKTTTYFVPTYVRTCKHHDKATADYVPTYDRICKHHMNVILQAAFEIVRRGD